MFTPIPLYCDLDQVLYDWIGYTTSKYAVGLTQEQLNKHPNRVGILTEMYKQEPDFFRNIPLCAGARELINGLRNLERSGLIELHFLTATDTIHFNPLKVREDKLFALRRDFDVAYRIHVVLQSAEKVRFSAAGTILLDDYEKNIKEWQEHGGTGVWVAEDYCAKTVLTDLEVAIKALKDNTVSGVESRKLTTLEKLTAYGKLIRKIRVDLEINLKEMAQRLDVSSSYLSMQELGRKDVTVEWCRRVVDTLGISEAYYQQLVTAAMAQKRAITLDPTKISTKHAHILAQFGECYHELSDEQWNALDALVLKEWRWIC